jgi:hypothetical protein
VATSISIPYDQILRIVEGWLNEHELRQPHEVVDMDYIDASGGAINIGVRPRPEPVVAVEPPSDYTLPLHIGGAPTMPRNHGYNGHSAPQAPQPDADDVAPVSAPSEEPAPAQPAARRKRLYLIVELRARIVELRRNGATIGAIQEDIPLSESSIYRILGDAGLTHPYPGQRGGSAEAQAGDA